MILYNYMCPEHGLFEAFSRVESRHLPMMCPKCGEFSDFVVSTPRIKLEGITGHFPTAADKWAKLHEKEAKREPKD